MACGAQLTVTYLRRSTRHPVEFPVMAEHKQLGDLRMTISNISAHGFMINEPSELTRGQRVIIRLPHVGRIEAHVILTTGERSGFQFERILRLDDFTAMIETLQPNPRLCKTR